LDDIDCDDAGEKDESRDGEQQAAQAELGFMSHFVSNASDCRRRILGVENDENPP
jgi:hypothetical protein